MSVRLVVVKSAADDFEIPLICIIHTCFIFCISVCSVRWRLNSLLNRTHSHVRKQTMQFCAVRLIPRNTLKTRAPMCTCAGVLINYVLIQSEEVVFVCVCLGLHQLLPDKRICPSFICCDRQTHEGRLHRQVIHHDAGQRDNDNAGRMGRIPCGKHERRCTK